jgi:pimeloyl-ACP methyl ester carboxylesterase
VTAESATDAAAIVARIAAAATRRTTACGDGTMVWRLWGDGFPLVLLHGASGSWTHWIRNVEPLAARFHVLVPDMPGFGDSDSIPGPHTADVLADHVAAGLDMLLPPSAVLDIAGFSFGGIIGGLVAARLARRVRTLVLIGPGGLPLPYPPPPPLRRVESNHPGEIREVHRDNLGRLMIANRAAIDELAVTVQIDNLRRARFRSGTIPTSDALLKALPSVRARIAGIWGERDAYAAPYLDERRQLLARFQPDLDFRVIAGAGHWVVYEAADLVNAALLEILL